MKRILLASALLFTTPAWAQVPTIIPPVEFDKPFPGNVVIRQEPDPLKLHEVCKGTSYHACSWHTSTTCTIVVLPQLALNMVVLRHERAHCNKWPPSHTGARQPTTDDRADYEHLRKVQAELGLFTDKPVSVVPQKRIASESFFNPKWNGKWPEGKFTGN